MKNIICFLLALCSCQYASVMAQPQYTIAQQTSFAMSADERANLALAQDFWRDIMNRRDLKIATHFLTDDFISRNPNIEPGRDAFLNVLGNSPELIQNADEHEPEVLFASGPYVFLMWAKFVYKKE